MSGHSPKAGRPPISDHGALQLMARLDRIYAEGGVPRGARALAREIVERVDVIGASSEAAADRLRRKYRTLHQQGAEFSPIKSRAPSREMRHVSTDEAKAIGMYIGSEREPDGSTAATVEVDPAKEASSSSRASARIVERSLGSRRRGGPRHLIALHLVLTRSEILELTLRPSVAVDLAHALRLALVDLEQRRAASPQDEEVDADVG